jgi:hypothetical protein
MSLAEPRDLVVEPVLDRVGGQLSEPVRTELRKHVLVEVSTVGLLRRRRQAPAQQQELLSPDGERHVRVAGSTQCPRTVSASISRRKRSASALRVKVRYCTLFKGSANRARYLPRCFST